MDYKVLMGTLKKNLMTRVRAYPVSFFVGNVLTGFYTALGAWMMYHLLFRGKLSAHFVSYANTSDYMSYVIVGSLIYIFIVRTCLNVSRSLITELREGTLESLMLAPFRRGEYFIGNMLVQTVTTSLEVAVSLIIGFFFGLRLDHINLGSFIVLFVIGLYAFFGVSMLLGCIMLYTRDTYISQNTLFAFLFLVCGITFPTEYLPQFLRVISRLIPVTDITQLIRGSVLNGIGLWAYRRTILYVLIISSIYVWVGFKLMKKIEYIALEKLQG